MQYFGIVLSLLLVVSSGCRQVESKSHVNDIFTVTRNGRVLVFRGGSNQVTVRVCPDYAALKEAKTGEQVQAELAMHCPPTSSNEKVFRTEKVRKFVKEYYQRNYIPDGKPIDYELQHVTSAAQQKANEVTHQLVNKRNQLNENIAALEAQLKKLQAYYDANPDLVTPEIKAKLESYEKELGIHKTSLAQLSDAQIAARAESTRAQIWADGYADFLDQYVFSPMIQSEKLVRLSEANHPLHALIIKTLTALSQEEFYITLKANETYVDQAHFSPDGALASTTSDKAIQIWDTATGKNIRNLEGFTYLNGGFFSPDGNYVVAYAFDESKFGKKPGTIIWNAKNGALIRTLPNIPQSISKNSNILITGNTDEAAVQLWNIQTGELVRTLASHTKPVWGVTYSPDDKLIATGSADRTVKLWDPDSGALIRTISGHDNDVESVSFSSDSRLLLTGSALDLKAKLWSVATGDLIKTFASVMYQPRPAMFSPDDKLILTGQSPINLWRVETGEWVESLYNEGDAIFSSNGKFFATIASGNSINLRDGKTGELIETLQGHTQVVRDIAFSPDGKFLISASWDGTARIWDLLQILDHCL